MGNDWPPYPPPNETELERAIRLEEEKVAKRISDEIDKGIEKDRIELRKKRNQTRILLLGQAESGKSTLLKNFQLQYAPAAFHGELDAWRAVIQLNLVRSVNVMLCLLSQVAASPTPINRFMIIKPKDDFRGFKMRLAPLRQVEILLNRLLHVGLGEDAQDATNDVDLAWDSDKLSEVAIRSNAGWKTLLKSGRERPTTRFWDELDDARRILAACREDIVALCTDSTVQRILKEQGVVLLDEPGFFFDQAERIATLEYEPTSGDVLRARVRTVGVEEHVLAMEAPPKEKGSEWVFYDVGGDRNQRAAWAPYFEDVDAVMFLCPISCFDQVLGEDRTVNRLIDSMKLWEIICYSKLLANCTFILFLNKCDILKKKLESGIRFADHVEQYKDQPNTLESVATYIKDKMMAIHRNNSPKKRTVVTHLTCATDTNQMSNVLNTIRDVILVNTLEATNLIA